MSNLMPPAALPSIARLQAPAAPPPVAPPPPPPPPPPPVPAPAGLSLSAASLQAPRMLQAPARYPGAQNPAQPARYPGAQYPAAQQARFPGAQVQGLQAPGAQVQLPGVQQAPGAQLPGVQGLSLPSSVSSSSFLRELVGGGVAGLIQHLSGGAKSVISLATRTRSATTAAKAATTATRAAKTATTAARAAKTANAARLATRSRSVSSAGAGSLGRTLGLAALITVPLVALSDYLDYRAGKITAQQRNKLIVADSVGYVAAGSAGAWLGSLAAASLGGVGVVAGIAAGFGLSWLYESYVRPKLM